MSKRVDYAGKKFGKWLCIAPDIEAGRYAGRWNVRCECGKVEIRVIASITGGASGGCSRCAQTSRQRRDAAAREAAYLKLAKFAP